MKVALILAETVKFLHSLEKVDLPFHAAQERYTLLQKILNLGEELVDELATEGHCKVFLDCGKHEFDWNCRIKRGQPCPFNHLKGRRVPFEEASPFDQHLRGM